MFVKDEVGQTQTIAVQGRPAQRERATAIAGLKRRLVNRGMSVLALALSVAAAGYAQTDPAGATRSPRQTDPALRDATSVTKIAELIDNGDFERTGPPGESTNNLPGWSLVATKGAEGEIVRESTLPINELSPHSLRLTVRNPGQGCGVANRGVRGMKVVADAWYDLTFSARTETNVHFALTVTLEGQPGGKVCARATIPEIGGGWKQYTLPLHARDSAANARLVIMMVDPGTIWFDGVSLVPRAEVKGETNGTGVPRGPTP